MSLKAFKAAHVKLSFRRKRVDEMELVTCAEDAERLFRTIWSNQMDYIEEAYALYFNSGGYVHGWARISQGGLTDTTLDLRTIFTRALLLNAPRIILAHNHPSGSTKPSAEDIAMTRKAKAGGDLLRLTIVDHLILTSESSYSLVDHGDI